jgi:phosphoribosylformylglycinamidine cyclo-ligase
VKNKRKKGSVYEELGIDPHKARVKEIFGAIKRNDFPRAFCNIIYDPEHPAYAVTKHCDGSGSKSIQRCLHYLETGDASIFEDDVLDALSMNTGDVAAGGFVERYYLTDIIAINSARIDKEKVLRGIAIGMAKAIELYKRYGIEIIFLGGETADLPDQTNSYILDMDVFSRTHRSNIIKGDVVPGDTIFGFSSGGQAIWEKEKNSGQMSNGLTLSRIKLMHESYSKKYPFLCRPEKPYQGQHCVKDKKLKGLGMNVSQAILSPTRQWAIVIKLLINELRKKNAFDLLHGISMNTGGGATKIKNIGQGITFAKYMPKPLSYFKFIQAETGESWENMFVTYNMGIGLDIVGSNEGGILGKAIRKVSRLTKIKGYELGKCYPKSGENSVVLFTPYGKFNY